MTEEERKGKENRGSKENRERVSFQNVLKQTKSVRGPRSQQDTRTPSLQALGSFFRPWKEGKFQGGVKTFERERETRERGRERRQGREKKRMDGKRDQGVK